MNRFVAWMITATLAAGAAGIIVADAQQRERSVLIAGGGPVVEEQVRAKLQADGWLDIKIVVNGEYFEATGVKAGKPAKVVIDARTGRVAAHDNDDDDDDY